MLAPAATVTNAGTEAARLFEERLTTAPPKGAGRSSTTVPREIDPPVTTAGEIRMAESEGAWIVNVAENFL